MRVTRAITRFERGRSQEVLRAVLELHGEAASEQSRLGYDEVR